MIDLAGKRILVTGATSGIGRATAVFCKSAGAEVIITGRNKEGLQETQALMGGNSQIVVCDLTNEEDIANLVDGISAIDGFAHCAGIIQPYPIKYIRTKHIDTIFKINLNSAILLTSILSKSNKLNNNGSVVFVSSISANHPYSGGALYSASKSAIESFSRSFALEASSKGIRSNVVSPGLVRTKIFEETTNAYSEEELQSIVSKYPLGIGEPADVANYIGFLLSELSKWITGTNQILDGGLLINNR